MLALGVVHRDVRAADQRADVRPVVGRQRDADARAELDGDAADLERALERVEQPERELGRGAAVGQVAQQHGELVAAEPGQGVAAAQRLAQPGGDLPQQRVALVVAQRVVDLLEAVEVDQQQADELAAVAGRAGGAAHALVEVRAVRQAR